jgi:hypothetical protein
LLDGVSERSKRCKDYLRTNYTYKSNNKIEISSEEIVCFI